MAEQIRLPEMAEVQGYLAWLNGKSKCLPEIGEILYATDFRWIEAVPDDKNRAEDGLKWRDRYANEVGKELGSMQTDRIRKSIHGKTSCYEVILSLAEEINEMVNEEEEPKTAEFFAILLGNLGLNDFDEEDFDYREENTKATIREILRKWMDREYEKCDKNCIFPVTLLEKCDKKVSQTTSLWMQMNRWLEEHSDENGHFVTQKCHSVTVLK